MKKILLLPGVGDVHWVMLKLQSWLRQRGWGKEEVEVSIWNFDQRPRTLEYLDMIPWVKRGSYSHIPLKKEKARFDSLYIHRGSTDSILNFNGFDALIGTNGNMRGGVPFAEIMEDAECNWDYGPIIPVPEDRAERGVAAFVHGPYFVLGFSGFGMFGSHWLDHMPAKKVGALINKLREHYPDHRFIWTGCEWDRDFTEECAAEGDEVLVGETSLAEFLSLVKHAAGYLGWCGGNAILAQHLGTPTVVWWSRGYFPHHDRVGWETPHDRNVHLVLEVEDFRLERTVAQIDTFLEAARA